MEFTEITSQINSFERSVDDLPDEVLEFILGFLPPYKDLQDCMCVSKRWYGLSKNVMRKKANDLYRAISEFNVRWRNITPVDMAPSITKRFSHSACVHENSMFIFGGCTTNSTAFNDLWRFDLSKRQWIRPLTMGAYPSPKAYASLICYRDSLILFGGWTYPSLSQYYQDWTMFNEVHFYNITTNRWILINSSNNPSPMAGHSAMIKDDNMIVFGGLHKPTIRSQLQCSNDIWILNLKTFVWRKQPTADPKPCPRYGQSLIVLNDNRIMILGGVQALSNRCVYSDAWILKMEGEIWTWTELTIKNKEWSAGNIWCHPAIRVGDKVVSLSRCHNGGKHPVTSAVRMANAEQRATANSLSQRVEQNVRRPLDKDNNVNGQRGSLLHRRESKVDTSPNGNIQPQNAINRAGPSSSGSEMDKSAIRLRETEDNRATSSSSYEIPKIVSNIKPDAKVEIGESSFNNSQIPKRFGKGSLGQKFPSGAKIVRHLNDADKFKMAAFNDNPAPGPVQNQRRVTLEELASMRREFIERQENIPAPIPVAKKIRRNTLAIHVLDISSILNDNNYSVVSWMCPKEEEMRGAPEEFIMYTLVRGKGELIMFGGVHNDVKLVNSFASSPPWYSNSLHFITPPRDII